MSCGLVVLVVGARGSLVTLCISRMEQKLVPPRVKGTIALRSTRGGSPEPPPAMADVMVICTMQAPLGTVPHRGIVLLRSCRQPFQISHDISLALKLHSSAPRHALVTPQLCALTKCKGDDGGDRAPESTRHLHPPWLCPGSTESPERVISHQNTVPGVRRPCIYGPLRDTTIVRCSLELRPYLKRPRRVPSLQGATALVLPERVSIAI